MLHRSIIRLVLVGLSVAIEFQKRQCTVRSHGLITDNYYDIIYRYSAIYMRQENFTG